MEYSLSDDSVSIMKAFAINDLSVEKTKAIWMFMK